jgi:hypothetical protein
MSSIRSLTSQQAQAMGVRGISSTGDVDAPAVELSRKFTFQSYFDDVLGPAAILRQSPNQQIVSSTLRKEDLSGYAVALHPSSQTPVAITFRGGQQQGSSATFRLKPGEFLRPFGTPNGVPGKFSGFEWGLPFGWLGGGNAILLVFRTIDAKAEWTDRSEVIFHRIRIPVVSPANVPAAVPFNWPTRFPWPHAVSGVEQLTQAGTPVLSAVPTRTLLSLRMANLASSASMRVYFIGADELAEGPTGAVNLTEAEAYDVIWGVWGSIASANFATQFQYQYLPVEMYRLGANDGGVIFVDGSGGLLLNNQFVDVVRYGVL